MIQNFSTNRDRDGSLVCGSAYSSSSFICLIDSVWPWWWPWLICNKFLLRRVNRRRKTSRKRKTLSDPLFRPDPSSRARQGGPRATECLFRIQNLGSQPRQQSPRALIKPCSRGRAAMCLAKPGIESSHVGITVLDCFYNRL